MSKSPANKTCPDCRCDLEPVKIMDATTVLRTSPAGYVELGYALPEAKEGLFPACRYLARSKGGSARGATACFFMASLLSRQPSSVATVRGQCQAQLTLTPTLSRRERENTRESLARAWLTLW